MTKPNLLEIKFMLTGILNIDNSSLRQRTLRDAMELLSMNKMHYTWAENALKEEIVGNKAKADKWIQKILDEVDKEEYS